MAGMSRRESELADIYLAEQERRLKGTREAVEPDVDVAAVTTASPPRGSSGCSMLRCRRNTS